jgi:hypothetical protein
MSRSLVAAASCAAIAVFSSSCGGASPTQPPPAASPSPAPVPAPEPSPSSSPSVAPGAAGCPFAPGPVFRLALFPPS